MQRLESVDKATVFYKQEVDEIQINGTTLIYL